MPIIAGTAGIVATIVVVFGVNYFGSPKFTDTGYRPVQPVPYSHKLHAGDLGMDCRYCHTAVEIGAKATVPPTQTCMNCHVLCLPESEKLLPINQSWAEKKPMEWIRIHKIPDYAFFDHSAHIIRGVGCTTCHGRIDQMEVVMQVQPLSMGWCLDCHRNPDMFLRPLNEITKMDWIPPENQLLLAQQYKIDRNINPPTDCTACHR